VSIEHFEIAKFIHVTRAGRGAAVSITRIDADPASVDEVLWPYEEPHVASLTDSDGFCTAVVLVDRPSGKIVIETTWRDAAASLAGRGPAAKRLLDVASKGTAFVRSIEQYRLDFHSVELE
jgi:hypothetical protein